MRPYAALFLAALIACGEKSPGNSPAASTSRVTETPPGNEPAPVTMSCGDRTISGSGLGELKIGIPVGLVKFHCTVVRDTTELRAEGMPALVISVLFGSDTVDAEVVDRNIWRIEVNQPGFQTRDSLHVGTTLGRLLEFPGVHGAHGEDGVYLLSPRHCGLTFKLAGPGLQALPPDANKSQLERIASKVSVSRILITGCPA